MRATLPALLIVVISSSAARGEEPHIFRGKTVDGWLAVFRDKASTEARRREAVVMLGCFGPEARAAAPDLIEALGDGPLQNAAINALASIGSGAEVIAPILIDRFLKRGRSDPGGWGTFHHGGSSIGALGRVGEAAVPALQKVLDGPDANMRLRAAGALGEIGPAARGAVPSLIRAIQHPDPEQDVEFLVDYAIRALGRIGPEARAAIPALSRLLDERNGYHAQVAWALDRIGAPPVQRLLDKLLREYDGEAVNLLAWLGPKAREAVPSLRTALTDEWPRARIGAAVALAHIDPSATDAIPVLIESLSHRDDAEFSVGGVPGALGRLGPKARTALPLLIDLVTKGSADASMVRALVMIDPDGAVCVPALIAALKHEDGEVVHVAANCLGVLGPRARGAIAALAVAVNREYAGPFRVDEDPQADVARALRRVGPDAKSAIPALIRALKSRRIVGGVLEDCEAAAAAAESIGSFGTEARRAIPALIEILRSPGEDGENRPVLAVALALGCIRPEARAAVPVLWDEMERLEKYPWFQAEAVIALFRLAPDGRQLAERWLQKPVESWPGDGLFLELEARAKVLGAMGRMSFESDWVTRRYLERLDSELASSDPSGVEPLECCEWLFEKIGHLGVAGRLAVPRLNELRSDPNPFVRMWVAEALERITPPIK